jgi:sterol desaturase/sphingolipid hydroxylase (fatty acid hydroxylase superfamily)
MSKQIWDIHYGSVMTLSGRPAILAGGISAFALSRMIGMDWNPLSTWTLICQVVAMEVIGDLGLYLGHRIQHEIPFLWKFHSVHHTVETPTPLGAVYIDPLDAILQASLPILAAMAAVRPHPVAAYVYIAWRIGGNIANHSGLDSCWWLNLLFLKYQWLGRAKASHHDSHHKYGGRAGNVMNLGEGFWVWDWAFGTLSDRSMMRM